MKPYDSNRWRMVEDFIYLTPKTTITIPHGFVHDLASIPRPLNLIFRKHGKHTKAAILHDWCYHRKGKVKKGFVKLSRAECDRLFYTAMRECGVGWLKAKMMYYAVRAGGWASW